MQLSQRGPLLKPTAVSDYLPGSGQGLKAGGGVFLYVGKGVWGLSRLTAWLYCSVVGAPVGGRCGFDGIGPEGSGSPTKAQSVASHGSPEDKPAAVAPSGIHNSWKRKGSVSTHSPTQGTRPFPYPPSRQSCPSPGSASPL